ncbi:MAG: metallophosphoesterase [Acidobacteria bacterium]|nr:metallophosphoesterase [Acidobacteriota bacterium]
MQRRVFCSWFLLITLLVLGGCYVLRYSSPEDASRFSVPGKYRDIESYLNLYKDVVLEGLYFEEDRPFLSVPAETDGQAFSAAFQPDFSFFHLTDVQLRDERANLYSRSTSGFMDRFVRSVRFHADQEKYDSAVFQCLLLGIETHIRKAEGRRPGFLIHTGDSVHVSLMSEAWEFLYLLDTTLTSLPWFNVIGNHDVTVFGTPTLGRSARMKDPTLGFFPLYLSGGGDYSDPEKYIRMHGPESFNLDGIPFSGPVRRPNDLARSPVYRFHPDSTSYHGFDMQAGETDEADRMRGYYSFDFEFPNGDGHSSSGKIRVIVINTAEYVDSNALGGFSQRQIDWLTEQLKKQTDPGTRTIAFGHHPLLPNNDGMRTDGVYSARLKQVQHLFASSVDVYFSGHHHRQSYNREFGFLQVVAPSLLEYPQSGHLVKVDLKGDRMLVEIEPFSHAEMRHRENLRRGLSAVVSLFEPDVMVRSVISEIESAWKESPGLRTKEMADILPLWETDPAVRDLMDSLVPFGFEERVRTVLAKASLLRQAYLAREAALDDQKENRYFRLGQKLRFTVPFRRLAVAPLVNLVNF